MLTETQRLTELIEGKHHCLTQLRELGLRQAALISAENMTELLRMFGSKQRLIEQLQLFERQLDPFREQDPERRTWRSPSERARCAELVERSKALFEEIVDQERKNETDLKRRRDAVANKLQGLQSSREARNAYDDPALQSSLLDLRS